MTSPAAGSPLAANAVSGVLRYGAGAMAALLVTPYVLGSLGTEAFGVWALAGALLALIRLSDLGFRSAVTREVALAGEDAAGTLGAALSAGLLAGGAGILAVAVGGGLLVAAVGLGPEWRQLAGPVFLGTAVVAAIEAAFAPYQASLEGLGRMDVGNAIDGLQRIASAAASVAVLAAGFGLPGLVAKNACLALGAGLAFRWALGRYSPALASARPGWDRPALTRLWHFGRHVQAVNLAAAAAEPVTRGLIARTAGLTALATFEIASLVATQISGALLLAATAIFPAAARAGNRSEAGRLWAAVQTPLALAVVPALALPAVLGPAFIVAWLGSAPEAGAALRALLLGWLAALLALPAYLIAQGAGHPGRSTAAGLVTAAVSVAGVAVLAPHAGAVGAAAGRAAGLIAGGLAAWLLARRVFPPPSAQWLLAVGLPGLAGALVASQLVAYLPGHLGGVAGAGLAGLAVYALGVRMTGALDDRLIATLAGLWRRDERRGTW